MKLSETYLKQSHPNNGPQNLGYSIPGKWKYTRVNVKLVTAVPACNNVLVKLLKAQGWLAVSFILRSNLLSLGQFFILRVFFFLRL